MQRGLTQRWNGILDGGTGIMEMIPTSKASPLLFDLANSDLGSNCLAIKSVISVRISKTTKERYHYGWWPSDRSHKGSRSRPVAADAVDTWPKKRVTEKISDGEAIKRFDRKPI